MVPIRARHTERAQNPYGRARGASLTNSTVRAIFRILRFHLETDLSVYGGIESANTVSESMSSIACAFTGRMDMGTKSKSRIITEKRPRRGKSSQFPVARRLPTKRPPTPPGEMLLEEFLKPLGISQSAFAVRLGISFPRLNEIIRAKRSITPDTALRLAHVLGMSADFWLGLQQDWELWHALRSKKAAAIARLEPLRHVS
jgi:addiction module HigA family antidote